MIRVTGVRFTGAGKIYDFESSPLDLKVGDKVIVETQNSEDIAIVAYINKKIDESAINGELKQILRFATEKDIEVDAKNKERGKKYLGAVKEKVKEFGLKMSVVSVDYSFDGQKVIVNFTSEERVDFRDLLKELGSFFKKRVELRQIGARDETKLIGGIGACGQPCCCKRFLDDFGHVSVKMAKTQNLSLNPTKISGLCGRLMCCLAYENDFYQDAQKSIPKVGGMAKTPEGVGKLISTNILKEIATIKFVKGEETTIKDFAFSDIAPAFNCDNCKNNKEKIEEKPQKTGENSDKIQKPKKNFNKKHHKEKQNVIQDK